jgi:hypothetical protein
MSVHPRPSWLLAVPLAAIGLWAGQGLAHGATQSRGMFGISDDTFRFGLVVLVLSAVVIVLLIVAAVRVLPPPPGVDRPHRAGAGGPFAAAAILLLASVAGYQIGSPQYPAYRAVVSTPTPRPSRDCNAGAWSDVNWSRCDKAGADLSDATLTGADLTRADLTRADLTRADLSGVDLSSANLSGANLSGAWLFDAYMTGTDLSGANLTGATGVPHVMAAVTWNDTTCPDGTNSDAHANTCVGHGDGW